jgi:hypothetical protein
MAGTVQATGNRPTFALTAGPVSAKRTAKRMRLIDDTASGFCAAVAQYVGTIFLTAIGDVSMPMSIHTYDEDPVYRSILYYSFLFSVGFVPGLFVGYLLWG